MSAEDVYRSYDRTWEEIEDMLNKAIQKGITGKNGLNLARSPVIERE